MNILAEPVDQKQVVRLVYLVIIELMHLIVLVLEDFTKIVVISNVKGVKLNAELVKGKLIIVPNVITGVEIENTANHANVMLVNLVLIILFTVMDTVAGTARNVKTPRIIVQVISKYQNIIICISITITIL